jgi:hypothetical protein
LDHDVCVPSENFSGLAKHRRFFSLFPATTVLMSVA